MKKNSQTKTGEFSNIPTKSKRKPIKIESDRGEELYNSTLQISLKGKIIYPYSRFTDKGPTRAEKMIRTTLKFLKKPLFGKGNAGWLNELSTVIEQ